MEDCLQIPSDSCLIIGVEMGYSKSSGFRLEFRPNKIIWFCHIVHHLKSSFEKLDHIIIDDYRLEMESVAQ